MGSSFKWICYKYSPWFSLCCPEVNLDFAHLCWNNTELSLTPALEGNFCRYTHTCTHTYTHIYSNEIIQLTTFDNNINLYYNQYIQVHMSAVSYLHWGIVHTHIFKYMLREGNLPTLGIEHQWSQTLLRLTHCHLANDRELTKLQGQNLSSWTLRNVWCIYLVVPTPTQLWWICSFECKCNVLFILVFYISMCVLVVCILG